MLTQKLRNIWRSLFPAKKSVFSGDNSKNTYTQTGKNTDGKVQLLYHRDLKNMQTDDSKTESFQHDWWIN
jgi:hypothetical protein